MRTTALLLFITAVPLAAQDTVAVRGQLAAWQTLVVRARLGAQVSRTFVQVGDRIKGLDPLVMLSAPELLARVGELDAELSAAEEHLQILAEDVKIAARELASAERRAKAAAADLPTAQQAVELQQSRADEAEAQFRAGRASSQEVGTVKQRLLEQQLLLRQAERLQADTGDELEVKRLRQGQAQLAVTGQRHHINAVRGRRETAAALAQQCDVKSVLPTARVARVFVGKGDVVAPGEPLVELIDDAKVRLELRVPSRAAARVRAGTAVKLTLPGGGGLTAKVAAVRGVLDADDCMGALVELDNADGRWLPGAQVEAELQLAEN